MVIGAIRVKTRLFIAHDGFLVRHLRDTPPQALVTFTSKGEHTTMPIPYTQRREYRLKLVEQLPSALRGKIALRNIETFASFPAQARRSLENAVLAGLTQIPRAIRLLTVRAANNGGTPVRDGKDNPHLSAEELLADRVDAAHRVRAVRTPPRQL